MVKLANNESHLPMSVSTCLYKATDGVYRFRKLISKHGTSRDYLTVRILGISVESRNGFQGSLDMEELFPRPVQLSSEHPMARLDQEVFLQGLFLESDSTTKRMVCSSNRAIFSTAAVVIILVANLSALFSAFQKFGKAVNNLARLLTSIFRKTPKKRWAIYRIPSSSCGVSSRRRSLVACSDSLSRRKMSLKTIPSLSSPQIQLREISRKMVNTNINRTIESHQALHILVEDLATGQYT